MKIGLALWLRSSEFSWRLVRFVDFAVSQNPVSLFWSHDSAHIRMKQRVRTGQPLWGGSKHKCRHSESWSTHASWMLSWCGTDHIYVIRLDDSTGNSRIPMEEIPRGRPPFRFFGKGSNTNTDTQKAEELRWCVPIILNSIPVADQYLHWLWSSFDWKRKG